MSSKGGEGEPVTEPPKGPEGPKGPDLAREPKSGSATSTEGKVYPELQEARARASVIAKYDSQASTRRKFKTGIKLV